MSDPDRRRAPRIALQRAVSLVIGNGGHEVPAITENLSSAGVLLYADQLIRQGSEIGLILVVPPVEAEAEGKWMWCLGKVLVSRISVSSTFPALPTLVSNIGPSIPWKPQANALEAGDAAPRFRVTHPFHPLFGQSLELAAQAREWGEERVYYRDPTGRMRFLPARWTSVAAPDPFVLMAAGRAYFRLEDLIRLHDRGKELQGWTSQVAAPGVKENTPQVLRK